MNTGREFFARDLTWAYRHGFRLLAARELAEWAEGETRPSPRIVYSLGDGGIWLYNEKCDWLHKDKKNGLPEGYDNFLWRGSFFEDASAWSLFRKEEIERQLDFRFHQWQRTTGFTAYPTPKDFTHYPRDCPRESPDGIFHYG